MKITICDICKKGEPKPGLLPVRMYAIEYDKYWGLKTEIKEICEDCLKKIFDSEPNIQ